jgi:coenzyme F420 hydrogenase subunit beta
MDERDKIKGQNELQEMVLNTGLCTGCGACIDLCPYFRSYRGKTAILFPCTLTQGRCFAYCPKVEVDLDELSQKFFGRLYDGIPLGSYQTIMIARAGKTIERSDFQAGGTVSALTLFALKKGYIDGAVLTDRDGLLPVPRFVIEPEEVLKCASSKYTSAPTLSALNRAISKGFRKIGIVATPCQALAIALMRSNPLKNNGFIDDPIGLVIGLFCTWAMDFRAFEGFLSARVNISGIKKIDIPPPPAEVMEIFMKRGKKITIPLDEVRELLLEGCSYCIDMTAEFSDISVGVLEGHPDMNTLIVRTERGQEIVDNAIQEGYIMASAIPEENLQHLIWASLNKKRRALIKAKQEEMLNKEGNGTFLILRAEVLEKLIASTTRRLKCRI